MGAHTLDKRGGKVRNMAKATAKKTTVFTINGKVYRPATLDFNAICDMEDMGISLGDYRTKTLSTARAYMALYFGGDTNVAGAEIQSHIVGGGNLEGLYDALKESINESDFFQATSKGATENQSEETAEKA